MGERFTVAKEGERPSRSTDVGRVLRANLVLIAGAIAWWGCHYLLLWNADVAAADRFVAGYDSRFMLSIGGTVIALGVLAFAAYRKPGFVYANWAPAYGYSPSFPSSPWGWCSRRCLPTSRRPSSRWGPCSRVWATVLP